MLIEVMFKKECCTQCRHVRFKGTMTKWSVQKQTHRTAQKHAEHQDATDIQNKTRFLSDFLSKKSFEIILMYYVLTRT